MDEILEPITTEVVDENIATVERLKAKHIEELKAEKAKYSELFKKYTENIGSASSEAPQVKEPTKDDLTAERLKLCQDIMNSNGNMTNLDMATKLVRVNDIAKSLDGKSIFLGNAKGYTDADVQNCERIEQILKDSIEAAAGDSDVFSTLQGSKLIENLH